MTGNRVPKSSNRDTKLSILRKRGVGTPRFVSRTPTTAGSRSVLRTRSGVHTRLLFSAAAVPYCIFPARHDAEHGEGVLPKDRTTSVPRNVNAQQVFPGTPRGVGPGESRLSRPRRNEGTERWWQKHRRKRNEPKGYLKRRGGHHRETVIRHCHHTHGPHQTCQQTPVPVPNFKKSLYHTCTILLDPMDGRHRVYNTTKKKEITGVGQKYIKRNSRDKFQKDYLKILLCFRTLTTRKDVL